MLTFAISFTDTFSDVILSHFNVHGQFELTNMYQFNINWLLKSIFMTGNIANYIFIIITGYFLTKSKINYKRIIGLILDMLFYSYLIFAILCLFKVITPSPGNLIKAMFPMFYGNWFVIYYIILYLISPILNYILNTISKENLKKILFLITTLVFVIPTFTNALDFTSHDTFIVCYFIGGYISLYYDKKIDVKKIKKIIFFDIILLILGVILIYIIGLVLKNNTLIFNCFHFVGINKSVFNLVLAVCIFLLCKNKNIKYNKVINTWGGSVLGIYLIHDNDFLRNFLWNNVVPNNMFFDEWYFFLFAIAKVLIVFMVCLVMDRIRLLLFKNLCNYLADNIYAILIKIYNKFKIKILKRS